MKEAREKKDEARDDFKKGIDPSKKKIAENLGKGGSGSFEAVARGWYEKFSPTKSASLKGSKSSVIL